jgi:hypothetical protein
VKIHPVGAELFHANSWTDGQTDMTMVVVAFHNFANVPNYLSVCIKSSLKTYMQFLQTKYIKNSHCVYCSNGKIQKYVNERIIVEWKWKLFYMKCIIMVFKLWRVYIAWNFLAESCFNYVVLHGSVKHHFRNNAFSRRYSIMAVNEVWSLFAQLVTVWGLS